MKPIFFCLICFQIPFLFSQSDCYLETKTLYDAAELKKAEELMETCQDFKSDTSFQLLGVRIYLSLYQPLDAIATAQQVLRVDPKNQWGINGMGSAYYLLHKFDSSRYYYNLNLQIDPRYKNGYYNSAMLYNRVAMYDSAFAHIRHYQSVFPENLDGIVLEGDIWFDFGNEDSAIICYDRVYNMKPSDPLVLNMLAKSYNLTDDYDKAMECINEAIRLKPACYEFYCVRGLIYYYLDDEHTKEAIKDFKYAQKLVETGYVYYYLALCYEFESDNKKALQYYNKAIALDSTDSDFFANKALLLFYSEDYTLALWNVEKAIALSPDDFYYKVIRARIYLEMGEHTKAFDELSAIIEADSTNGDAYFYRALVREEMGKYSAALRDYDAAIRCNPEDTDALYNRALLKSEMDDPEGAIEDYTKVVEIDPTYSDAYINRGIIYYEQDDMGEFCSNMRLAVRYGDKYGKKLLKKYC